MLIAIFGESCVGKTTFCNLLKENLSAKVFSGKDYLRLAKNEAIAKKEFINLLQNAVNGENIIYVITEIEHLSFIPSGAVRVLMTASLPTIKERFAKRTGGILPPALVKTLEAKHGCFDNQPYDFLITEQDKNLQSIINNVISFCNK